MLFYYALCIVNCELLKVCLNLFYRFGVLLVGKVGFVWVHLENATPFVAAVVFRHNVHMQMATRVTVCAVVYFVGVKCFMHSICRTADICHKHIAFLLAYVYYFAYMVAVGYYDSARF